VNEAVLDASALLALLNGEPGADQVAQYIPGALINAVNLCGYRIAKE
jgi:PIN domain nuclease of toxin-antitoxin system